MPLIIIFKKRSNNRNSKVYVTKLKVRKEFIKQIKVTKKNHLFLSSLEKRKTRKAKQ